MLSRLALAAASCCILSIPVLADEFAFSEFAQTVVIGNVSLDNPKALPTQPVAIVIAGKLMVTLEKTRLEDVQAEFGSTVQKDNQSEYGITWLCYITSDATLWFSAFTGNGTVSQVTSEADTAHAGASGCGKAPAGLTTIDYGIPGLGAPLADLTAKFGKVDDDVGLYSYSSEVPSPETPDSQTFQYVVAMAPKGVVSGITVGQLTSN